MINAHKGDHVLIAMPGAKLECHEVTNATYNFITVGKQVFWRTTGQSANGCLEHPYIVRKVSPDKVEFAKEYSTLCTRIAEFDDMRHAGAR